MTAVPITRTWVVGEVVLDTHFNVNIRDPLNYLLTPPVLRCRQTTLQTYTTGAVTAVTYTTEDVDSSGMHSNVTNTSRATAVYPGWYLAAGGISFAPSATNRRIMDWAVNGTAVNGSRSTNTPVATLATCVAARVIWVFLNVTDYLEQDAFQDSGGNLNSSVTGIEQSSFDLGWGSN